MREGVAELPLKKIKQKRLCQIDTASLLLYNSINKPPARRYVYRWR